jgi:hypothetical protein
MAEELLALLSSDDSAPPAVQSAFRQLQQLRPHSLAVGSAVAAAAWRGAVKEFDRRMADVEGRVVARLRELLGGLLGLVLGTEAVTWLAKLQYLESRCTTNTCLICKTTAPHQEHPCCPRLRRPRPPASSNHPTGTTAGGSSKEAPPPPPPPPPAAATQGARRSRCCQS